MTQSNRPNLAQTLSEELHHSSQSDLAEQVRELQEIIAAAPERSDFSDTRKILITMGLSATVLFALAIAFAMDPKISVGAPIGLGLLGVFGAAVAYQHRKDGSRVLMTLTRTELLAPNLDGPVPLTAITGIEVVEATHTYSNLHVDDVVKLPKATRQRGLLACQVLVMDKKKNRKVVLASAGLKVNGKKLDLEAGVELFELHLAAAHATRELQELTRKR